MNENGNSDGTSANEKFLKLQQELKSYKKALKKATRSMLDQEVTRYPIFVLHQQEVELGIPIVDREKVQGNWSVNVSSLEEFVQKRLIQEEKMEEFQEVYKDPEDYFCLFVISELGAQFIFLPVLTNSSS